MLGSSRDRRESVGDRAVDGGGEEEALAKLNAIRFGLACGNLSGSNHAGVAKCSQRARQRLAGRRPGLVIPVITFWRTDL